MSTLISKRSFLPGDLVNGPRGAHRRWHRSTCTITAEGRIVPWLGADGPLAYCPESPPARDYYFQYGWVLPEIFADGTSRRQHYYFGGLRKEEARDLFSFWQDARNGRFEEVALVFGTVDGDRIAAPLAIYRIGLAFGGSAYLFIQHGSYQVVRPADQPALEAGAVTLYRGLQNSAEFRFFSESRLAANRRIWQIYERVQAKVLSDSILSFNSIHDRAARSETGHIRDRSWVTDDLARQEGLDIDAEGLEKVLWTCTHQSYALERWVAERKFGPNYVVCTTPLTNIRLTTFFAGEREVRVIDPTQVEIVELHGCHPVSLELPGA